MTTIADILAKRAQPTLVKLNLPNVKDENGNPVSATFRVPTPCEMVDFFYDFPPSYSGTGSATLVAKCWMPEEDGSHVLDKEVVQQACEIEPHKMVPRAEVVARLFTYEETRDIADQILGVININRDPAGAVIEEIKN